MTISSDGRVLRPYEHPDTKIFTMETKLPVRVDSEFCFRSACQFMTPKERVIATAERHLISARLREFFEHMLTRSSSVSMGTMVSRTG